MSLMGVLMLVGIADSNSILIVDFAHNLERQGWRPADAVINRVPGALRPILIPLWQHNRDDSDGAENGDWRGQYAPMAKPSSEV